MGCNNCTDINTRALGMLKETVEATQKAAHHATVASNSAISAAIASWILVLINFYQVFG